MYVYVLSDYGEYGAEHVVATLDRTRLPALLKRHWDDGSPDEQAARVAHLRWLLAQSDEDLAGAGDDGAHGHELEDAWGGVLLHVVELS
jgi:hypothetical protein